MKAIPLTIHWHEHNQPIYSAHFEPNGKGRLATAGGDTNVRVCLIFIWLNPRVRRVPVLTLHRSGGSRVKVRRAKLST